MDIDKADLDAIVLNNTPVKPYGGFLLYLTLLKAGQAFKSLKK